MSNKVSMLITASIKIKYTFIKIKVDVAKTVKKDIICITVSLPTVQSN